MRVWHVDDGIYKAAYFDAVARAQVEIPNSILGDISIPQAIALPKEYIDQPVKILISGQETLGNCNLRLQGSSGYRAWEQQMGGNLAFDYAFGGDGQENGPFWSAFEEVAQSFNLPNRRALGWSNLLKVQLLEPIGRSYSVVKLADGCMPIIVWQRALFQAEMDFIAPHAILFFSGDRRWALNHMYANVEVNPVQDAGFDIVTIPALPIPIVQTYHPYAYNTRVPVAHARANALVYLQEELAGILGSR